MKYIHTSSCNQSGYGVYKGIPYQEGYGPYQGHVFQRGHGLGGALGNFFKVSIKPALKAGFERAKKHAGPAFKRIATKAGKRTEQKALETAMDIMMKKKDMKQAVKDSPKLAEDIARAVADDAIKEVKSLIPHIMSGQSGRGNIASGQRKSRKRKRVTASTSSKRARHTIFD